MLPAGAPGEHFATPGPRRRFLLYSAVSVVAFGLAQVGLAVAYGILDWPVAAAVLFSLVVSAGPAYLLNRRFVWPTQVGGQASAGEAGAFFAVALAGSVVTLAVVALAERLARAFTSAHVTLSLVVSVASVGATAVVWVGRYVVLDRVVFPPTATRLTRSLSRTR